VEVSPSCDEGPMGSSAVPDGGRQDEQPHEAVSNERFDGLCNLRSQLRANRWKLGNEHRGGRGCRVGRLCVTSWDPWSGGLR
jgi:hypothetical protein